MTDDLVIIETRSRSRSKTPGILFGENGDSGKKSSKKIPTISLIEEEDDVIEVVPTSQPSQGATRPKRQRRLATKADTSADVSIESSKNLQKEVTSTVSSTTVTEKVKKSINGSEESTEQTTTVTRPTSNEGPEVPESQSIFNNIFNAIKTSTPILSKRSTRIVQNVEGSINAAEHPAYKEYKEAGEYWNKTPKTDYTYSPLSPHRRELANGIVAMPNMSRRSLEKYQNRVEMMIQHNPTEESFIRRKFLSNISSSFQKRSADLQYDSADEVDVSELRRQLQARRKPADNILSRFFLSIVTFMYSVSYSAKRNARRIFYPSTEHCTPIRSKQQGIFRAGFESVKNFILLGFSKVYLTISTVLCLDTWILYTRSENLVENGKRKRFLLFLLILLPLLLLAALLLSDDSSLTEIISKKRPSFHSVLQLFEKFRHTFLGWEFKSILDWMWTPLFSLGAGLKEYFFSNSFNMNFKKDLDQDKFQLLIKHVDEYIETTIAQRLEKNRKLIIKESQDRLVLMIAGTVQDSLENYEYQLTPNDIDTIATRIKTQLEEKFSDNILSQTSIASNEHFLKIQENINVRINQIQLNNQNIQLNEILARILSSEELVSFIDSRVKPEAFNTIDQRNIQIEEIKHNLEKLSEDFSDLRSVQKNLGDDFYKLKLDNDERFRQFLFDLDEKFNSLGDSHYASIDTVVKKNLAKILGFNNDVNNVDINEESIKSWISSIFVAKIYLEERLASVEANSNKAFQIKLDQNAGILMDEINNEINKQVIIAVTAKTKEFYKKKEKVAGSLSEADVFKIVTDVLAVYDADKTGLVDFALETAGGQVLSTRCTENYQSKNAEISIFGIPLWFPSNTPRTVISPNVQPGDCWAFKGFPGYLVVKLNNIVQITGFTMEHIPQTLAPNGKIDSAPKNFSVWGLLTEVDNNPILFGKYQYSSENGALQYFSVQNIDDINKPYQIIELIIESNHGNPLYTCIYRFRVHGNVK